MAIDLTELEWAINDVTLPNANGPNKIEPVAGLKTSGVDWEQLLNAEELNWMFYKLYKAIEDLDSRTIVAGQLPIGSIYINATDNRNPGVILGYGTWTARPGLTIAGAGTYTDSRGESRTLTAGEIVGSYQEIITTAQLPSHAHYVGNQKGVDAAIKSPIVNGAELSSVGVGPQALTTATGSGQAHNNMQPTLIAYMWIRTA